jgi:hypothetical protein
VLPLGLGFGGDSGIGFGAIYDCTRQRTWRTKDIDDGDENADVDVRLVRATSWVVRRKVGSEFRTELWNPDDGRFAPIAGWNAGKTIALHPDGRVMVLETSAFDRLGRIRQDSPPGKLLLLDPERGVREELALPDALKSRLIDGWSYGFTIDGDLLLTLRCLLPDRAGYGTEWIARFDPRTDQLVCIGPFGMLHPDVLGCPDRESVVFVAEQRRLMRAHFDGRPTETLFPR